MDDKPCFPQTDQRARIRACLESDFLIAGLSQPEPRQSHVTCDICVPDIDTFADACQSLNVHIAPHRFLHGFHQCTVIDAPTFTQMVFIAEFVDGRARLLLMQGRTEVFHRYTSKLRAAIHGDPDVSVEPARVHVPKEVVDESTWYKVEYFLDFRTCTGVSMVGVLAAAGHAVPDVIRERLDWLARENPRDFQELVAAVRCVM